MSEHDEQKTFFDWVGLNRQYAPNLEVRKALKLCYAVPNGAHMTIGQRGKMVGEGMTKGILDINLDWSVFAGRIDDWGAMDPGLRIEMKYGANKLTPEQKEKKKLLEEAGFKVAVCYSASEAVKAVFEYLSFKIKDYQGIKEFLC